MISNSAQQGLETSAGARNMKKHVKMNNQASNFTKEPFISSTLPGKMQDLGSLKISLLAVFSYYSPCGPYPNSFPNHAGLS